MDKYDSRMDTVKHIHRVSKLMRIAGKNIENKENLHDKTKLSDPEKSIFDEFTPKLKHSTYGSDEYNSFLKSMKSALDHHYENNRHHPEHFGDNGVTGMNLMDLIEMVCDWKAATERHNDGDVFKSLEINQKRFNYSNELKAILKNTIEFIIEVDERGVSNEI